MNLRFVVLNEEKEREESKNMVFIDTHREETKPIKRRRKERMMID